MSEKEEKIPEQKKPIENEEVSDYELVEIPIDHRLAIKSPDGNILGIERAMVTILNEIKDIKKLLG